MILLGVSGKAGVGKDTVGDYLVSKYDWKKISFASNLKDCCKEVFGLSHSEVYDTRLKELNFSTPIIFNFIHFSSIVQWMRDSLDKYVELDFDMCKKYQGTVLKTPRSVLQFVGTEIMRGLYDNYHVEVCLNILNENGKYVISDVRFMNEVESIIGRGGMCVRVIRETLIEDDNNKKHASETQLDSCESWFHTIDNSVPGKDKLYFAIEEMLERIEKCQKVELS
jgi:hypothetical protein